MSVKLWGYKPGSKSVRALSDALGFKILKHEGSKWRPKDGDVVINWGGSQLPQRYANTRILNKPEAVVVAKNKLETFKTFQEKGISHPLFTTDKAVAQEWREHGKTVVCRQTLTGHSGQGIVIVTKDDLDIPDALCYTSYIKKDAEYRIHVMGGEIIDAQRKIRDPEREPTNWRVRSHENGFIFVRNDLVIPEKVKELALEAIKALGLDFGGVDLIYRKRDDTAWCLEINTAVGLEGATVESYANGFRKLLQT